MIREEAIESFKCSNEQAKLRLEVEKMRMESGEIKELKFYIERDEMAIKALEQEPKTGWIPITKRLPEEREWIGTKKFGTTKSDSKEQASFNFMAAVPIHSDFGAQENKICHYFHSPAPISRPRTRRSAQRSLCG